MNANDRTTESLLARRALAEKATPGPWYADSEGFGVRTQYTPLKKRTVGYACSNDFVCDLNDEEYHEYLNGKEQANTAAHIAANSPDIVMADIDEILRLREEVGRLGKAAFWLATRLANALIDTALVDDLRALSRGLMHPPTPGMLLDAACEATQKP